MKIEWLVADVTAVGSLDRAERATVEPRLVGHPAIRTPQQSGHGSSGTQPRESNGKKSKKMIKNEVPTESNVLPDSAQGASRASNPLPYILRRRLGPLSF